jgi:hypothetical protein
MKLNRIVAQWKVYIRTRKVERLRFTIISHRHYRTVLQDAVKDWREFVQKCLSVKQGLGKVQKTVHGYHRRYFFLYLTQHLLKMRDLDAKAEQGQMIDPLARKRLTLRAWRTYISDKHHRAEMNAEANKLRTHFLLWSHFRSLQTFQIMRNNKLEGTRKVTQYLQQKYKQRVLQTLRQNW